MESEQGVGVRIQDIAFEGNTVYSDTRLRLKMKKTKESGLLTRVLKKDIYNPGTIEEDLDGVRELYKNSGYKNILLGDPEIEVRALRPEAHDSGAVGIAVQADEGTLPQFGALLPRTPAQPGVEVAAVDHADVTAAVNRHVDRPRAGRHDARGAGACHDQAVGDLEVLDEGLKLNYLAPLAQER